MSNKPALFSENVGRRLKTALENAEKTSALLPPENKARILSGYTSPVVITGAWMQEGSLWKCKARRLWKIDNVYQTADNDTELDLYHPTSMEQPPQGTGERVFALFRGVWEMVSGAASGIASSEPATIIEPLRRPLFRNVIPDHLADANTPEGNAARCMGTIALPGKTYSPIEVSPGVYQKRRKPLTGSNRFVVRENGKTSEGIEWIYCDDTPYDGEGTTTDREEAQLNYDLAICYNLDWSELLIEGDKVEYIARDGYYEVKPIELFTTPVEGQADVIVYEVEPLGNDIENPTTWQWTEIDSQHPQPPTPPNFEAVYLKLDIDRCTPILVKTVGICNDCTSLRVRGVFIRTDIKGRRYPMLFELPTLRAGGAIRAREVSCYYPTEHDKCAPVGNQPEMQLVRMNDWRLTLSPNVCTVPSTSIIDPIV